MHKTDGGREIECVKANHGRDGWAQPIAEVVEGTGDKEAFRGFKVDGDPWWDYESIRRQRRQDQRIVEKRAEQEARDASKAERHPDDVGNGRGRDVGGAGSRTRARRGTVTVERCISLDRTARPWCGQRNPRTESGCS